MKLVYLFFLFGLLACGQQKTIITADASDGLDDNAEHTELIEAPIEKEIVESPPNNEPFNVKISITHYTQYCGGAAPSEETLSRLNQPEANTSFVLLNLETQEKSEIKTDSTGTIYLNLPIGKYAVREKFKDCDYETFVSQNPTPTGKYHVEVPDTNCYKNWWAANLSEFEIVKDSPVQFFNLGTRTNCFTGNNPCIYYNGPHPP